MEEIVKDQIRKTPLFEPQERLGASFGEVFGWVMARDFGDPVEEQRRVRNAAGLIDLSFCGAIKVGGKEGAQFLHGLITNDVKGLEKGQGVRAAFLSGHGKIKAFCRVLCLGQEYLIINDPHTHDKIYKYVFPFSYAGDFKAEDVSDQYRILSVQGQKAQSVMKEVCFEPIPPLAEQAWVESLIAGQQVLVVRASHTGETGYDILVRAEGLKDLWDFILMKGEFHSVAPVGQTALDRLRIEAGMPVYGVDVDENNMMLEAAIADAVSFTKGCYTGQEAVAMATYRGHVSKKLSGLAIASDIVPSAGDTILKDDKEIGKVTSAIYSDSLGAVIALGLVKYGFFDPGTALEVIYGGEHLPATVVELPFYRAEKTNDLK
jgi:glycine cleavage system T protein